MGFFDSPTIFLDLEATLDTIDSPLFDSFWLLTVSGELVPVLKLRYAQKRWWRSFSRVDYKECYAEQLSRFCL